MGCHFNDLIENGFSYPADAYSSAHIEWAGNLFNNEIKNSIVFHAGELDSYSKVNPIKELVFLPFEKMFIEIDVPLVNHTFGLWVLGDNHGKLNFFMVFIRKGNKWLYRLSCEFVDWNSAKLVSTGNFASDRELSSAVSNTGFTIISFLSAINCTNVQRVENKPSEKLQKARIKRGKQPLFSYWTLHVDLDRDTTQATSQGGTHAPPRLHLRRGHARQYAPGKYCWVRACAVGNGKLGMVHKDYAVNA